MPKAEAKKMRVLERIALDDLKGKCTLLMRYDVVSWYVFE